MENTNTEIIYTEQEIKNWFEIMKKKYPHSLMEEHLSMVQMAMFDSLCQTDNLKTNVKLYAIYKQ